MGKRDNKLMRRRLVNAYMSSVISISLVLLLVGVACMLLLNAGSVSDYFKENMGVSVILKPDVTEDQALAFQDRLEDERFVKSVTFISREQGEEEMKQMLGEDFLDVFETSPIPFSFDIRLGASYVSSDSLEVVKGEIQKSVLVDEVNYQETLVDAMNSNFRKISIFLAVIILLLLFVSFVLINNTVRVSVFARRFTIHTMKLVGASRSFIRRPFLWQASAQGVVSAIVANAVLWGLLSMLKNRFGYLAEVLSIDIVLLVMGIVLVTGLLLCVVSTYFVVNKLVALGKDDLYY
ncbi:MAG: FtsX-like permease family protein [Bacteroidales bacterium]|nr:FtsX-like permease family protein [Bacteroidales bacterium]